jgi:hypothetical protein
MLPALKLSLDGFQLRDHPLLRRDPPDDEGSITDALPTEVSKTQEREGLWLPHSALFPSGAFLTGSVLVAARIRRWTR